MLVVQEVMLELVITDQNVHFEKHNYLRGISERKKSDVLVYIVFFLFQTYLFKLPHLSIALSIDINNGLSRVLYNSLRFAIYSLLYFLEFLFLFFQLFS